MNARRGYGVTVVTILLVSGAAALAQSEVAPSAATEVHDLASDFKLSDADRVLELDRSVTFLGLKLGGVIFDALKVDKPIQFLNPQAPARYGWGEANLIQDTVTNRPMGLRLFSLKL